MPKSGALKVLAVPLMNGRRATMRDATTTILALAAVWVATGCASAPVQRDFAPEVTIPASFGDVWDTVIDIFGERLWTIANMDRSSGFINSEWMSSVASPEYLDCGKSGLSSDVRHRGRFNIVIRESEGGVILRVNSTWQADREALDGSTAPIECLSTGVLEGEIQAEVRDRVVADG